MTDFLSLDKETRAHALVGSFLQTWAVMERELDATIAEALGIHSLQELILCTPIPRMSSRFCEHLMQFRYKIQHLVRDRPRRAWRTQRVSRRAPR
jgi:hypothetical protein